MTDHVCVICGEESAIIRSGFRFCRLHHAELDVWIEDERAAGRRVNLNRWVVNRRTQEKQEAQP